MTEPAVRAGILEGLGSVYSLYGGLLPRSDERLLLMRQGCELAVSGTWRVFFAKAIFHSLPRKSTGKLYITDCRIVFIREIDPWKEARPLMTPLGIPTGIAKNFELKAIKERGGRHYCVLDTNKLRVRRSRRWKRGLQLFLEGSDGERYVATFYTDVADPAFLSLLEGQFSAPGQGKAVKPGGNAG